MPSKLRSFLKLIRFEHTLFALPYVYIGLLLSPGPLTPLIFLLATLCAVTARTSAMLLNRIVDREIDRRNPRTEGREGMLREVGGAGIGAALLLSVGGLALFTYLLSPLLMMLVPVAVGLFVVYPFTKRFTAGSHLLLGLSLAVAPVGGFLAGAREFPFPGADIWPVALLSLAVLFWVAGFDVIYALDDLDFDRRARLHSIPAHLGYRGAQAAVAALYSLALLCLFAVPLTTSRVGYAWFAACVATMGALLWEQVAVARGREEPAKRKSAFNANLALSPLLLAALALDLYLV